MRMAIGVRWRAWWLAPRIVTVAVLAAACSSDGDASRASGGMSSDAGSEVGGGGGADAGPPDTGSAGGGSGGAGEPSCPATPPNLTDATECTPEIQQAGGCRYHVECQSGPVDLTFTCKQDGSSVVQWTVTPDACSFPFDTCPGTNVRCHSGQWLTRQPGDPPQACPDTCPETKPAPGAETCITCPADCTLCATVSCGYRCSSGSGWTVGTTVAPDAGCTSGIWQFDDACGDE